jgi:hypothetical protein
MGWQFSTDDFSFPSPASAGSAFRVAYQVTNTGSDEPAHSDRVQMWGSDGTQHIDQYEHAPDCVAGGLYGVFVDIPPMQPGFYDISVTLPDGTGAGASIIVQ